MSAYIASAPRTAKLTSNGACATNVTAGSGDSVSSTCGCDDTVDTESADGNESAQHNGPEYLADRAGPSRLDEEQEIRIVTVIATAALPFRGGNRSICEESLHGSWIDFGARRRIDATGRPISLAKLRLVHGVSDPRAVAETERTKSVAIRLSMRKGRREVYGRQHRYHQRLQQYSFLSRRYKEQTPASLGVTR